MPHSQESSLEEDSKLTTETTVVPMHYKASLARWCVMWTLGIVFAVWLSLTAFAEQPSSECWQGIFGCTAPQEWFLIAAAVESPIVLFGFIYLHFLFMKNGLLQKLYLKFSPWKIGLLYSVTVFSVLTLGSLILLNT